MPHKQGSLLFDRYEIRRPLGEGSLGKVFEVFDRKTRKPAALKLLNVADRSIPLESVIRLRSEAEILHRLHHEAVIGYLDFVSSGDLYGLVTELSDLPSLEQHLEAHGPLGLDAALQLASKLAAALAFIHDNRMIHLDLKPSNVLYAEARGQVQVKLLDFGLSRLKGISPESGGGTLAYMSPEQTGILQKTIDHRADLYSLGVLLYQAVTGRLPFEEDDPALLTYRHVAQPPEPPSLFRPDLPGQFERVILKLMAKDPDDRYHTTGGLSRDLDKYRRLAQAQGSMEVEFPLGGEDHWDSFPPLNPFVGREVERAQLELAIASLLPDGLKPEVELDPRHGQPVPLARPLGQGGLFLLEGGQGVGKTRLLQNLYNDSKQAGGRVWYHACMAEEHAPFLRDLKALMANLDQEMAGLAASEKEALMLEGQKFFRQRWPLVLELIPSWRVWDQKAPPAEGGNLEAYSEIAMEVISWLLMHVQRLVVIIDNLQRVEEASFHFFMELACRAKSWPLLVILAYDHEGMGAERAQAIQALDPLCLKGRLHLQPLTSAQTMELLHRLFSNQFKDLALILDPLYDLCNGNPALLRQTLLQLIDQGWIYYAKGHWRLREEPAKSLLAQLASQQLDQALPAGFDGQDLQILARAALFNRSFTLEALYHLCQVEPGLPGGERELVAFLDRAVAMQVLWVGKERHYGYRSSRLKKAMSQNLDEGLRSRLHSSLADFLIEKSLPRWSKAIYDIALHLDRAGRHWEAIQAYVRAAELTDNPSHTDAQAYIYYGLAKKKLALVGEGAFPKAFRFEVLYRSFMHQNYLNQDLEGLQRDLEQLIPLIEGDPHRELKTLSLRMLLAFRLGRRADCFAFGRQALALAESLNNRLQLASIKSFLGSIAGEMSYAERSQLLAESIPLGVEQGLTNSVITALDILVILLAYQGRVEEAWSAIAEVQTQETQLNAEEAPHFVIWAKCLLLLEMGEFEQALEVMQQVRQDALALHGPVAVNFFRLSHAKALGMTGREEEALRLFDVLIDQREENLEQVTLLQSLAARVMVAVEMQDAAAAQDYYEQALAVSKQRPDKLVEAHLRQQMAKLAMEQEAWDEAARLLQEAGELLAPLDAQAYGGHQRFYQARLSFLRHRDEAPWQEAKAAAQALAGWGISGFAKAYEDDLNKLKRRGSTKSHKGTGPKVGLMRLFEVNQRITSTLKLEELFSLVLEGAMQISGAQEGYLFTLELEQGTPNLELRLSLDGLGKGIPLTSQRYSTGIMHKAMETKKAVLTRDARREEQWKAKASVLAGSLRSVLCQPILFEGELKGILYLENHQAGSVFGPGDEEFVSLFATQAAIAIHNAESYGVLHRTLEENQRLNQELSASNRNLEEKVAQRTAELQALNQTLEQRVELEVKKNWSAEQLLIQQSKMAAMGEMISMIAHQWRQPLGAMGAITANLRVMVDLGLAGPEQFHQSLNEINDQTQYLSQTITDFRKFLSPNRQQEEFYLHDLVANAKKLIGKSLETAGVQVLDQCPPFQTPLKAYPNELLQVLLNLLKNAQDAAKEQGVAQPQIVIRGREEAGWQVLEVADNGGGIPPMAMPRLFEPYFTTKGQQAGTGLGLYMSKTIVEEHCHGRLEAANQGAGALFSIHLPVAP